MSGYEPPRIPGGGEHTDSWEHPEIKDAFDPLDTTDAINQAEKYWQMHQLWEQGVATFARSIQNSVSQAWSGPAAEASKKAIQDYTTDAHTLTPALAELHTRVRDAASAIVNTKKAIPDPVVVTWTSWAWPPHRWDLQRDQSEETQRARVAMNEHYVQPFSQIDGKIPILPTPTSPTKAVDIAPPPGGYSDDNSNSGQPIQSKPTSSDPSSTNSLVPGDKDGDGKPDDPGTSQQPGDQTTPEQTQTTPASTTPSNTQTTPAGANPTTQTPGTTPTSTDPTKTVPTGTGTPYTSGTPSRTGSPGTPTSPSPSTPQPGRSVPGTPTTPGTPTNPAAAAAAARGAAGMPGMGAPGMGARGGKSEDDAEHKIPDYLITQENTDELLGDLPKTIPGGVIGGDTPN
ncbi:hypothetical protein [Nocardia brasiliensis]|uniref:hypothetical protein n=1 Tax=Nocardia brasiliensis TaxID=37326 RepID=UPI00366E108B